MFAEILVGIMHEFYQQTR